MRFGDVTNQRNSVPYGQEVAHFRLTRYARNTSTYDKKTMLRLCTLHTFKQNVDTRNQ